MKAPSQLPCRQVVGWCSRPAGGADRCRGSEPSCGPAAARRRGSEQWDRCGFIPACRRFERRWARLSDAAASDPSLGKAFRRDRLGLWLLAIGLPFALTGLFKLLAALFAG